jgi:hypothetical protein
MTVGSVDTIQQIFINVDLITHNLSECFSNIVIQFLTFINSFQDR